LTPLDELSSLISGQSRAILLSQKDVDLRVLAGENYLFVLKMAEGSLAGGGRGGGFGERTVVMVALFRWIDGNVEKLYETTDPMKVTRFEIPYYVSRLPITLRDGTESMGYGVVEPDLVREYLQKIA
jgi:hypothetical protein